MIQIKELADKDFKANIISMSKKLMDNMVTVSDQIKTIKKNQVEIQEFKNSVSDMKNGA